MLKLHRRFVRRTYQCDMPGCRNRVSELDSRRADLSANPMHICDQCVIDLFRERGLSLGESTAERGAPEVNGGEDAVVASILTAGPEEVDTFDPTAGLPEIHPPAEDKLKKEEDAPRAARKAAGGTKSGKGKTGGRA